MSVLRRLRWPIWLLGLALVTAAMLLVRPRLDKAHVALVYLLVVLGASVVGGRVLGFTLAAIAFLAFNWFFLVPYNTLTIGDPFDWLVLASFLIVAGVAAEIVHRLRMEALIARQRTDEVDRLAALGAATLANPSATSALDAIAEVIRSTLGLESCRIHPAAPDASDQDVLGWVARTGRGAARLADGTTRVAEGPGVESLADDAIGLSLPLTAGGRTVGVLELQADRPIVLDDERRRFLAALSYYAALGVERVRLEAEAASVAALEEAGRLKDAVLASVSHDLRTPLTTIKALATELAAEGHERAETIGEEADRLNRLVADLLDLSRLRAGGFPIHPETTPIDELIGATLQRVSRAVGAREIRVSMEDGGTLLVGRFDLGQAIRILVNLIDNADKYSPPATPIDLDVTTEGDCLLIAVLDRGPGVPVQERERVFEPFYRPAGGIPDSAGAGLGLAIGRWLAEAQGGSLTFAPRDGGGSRFELRLPAVRLDQLGESL